MSKFCKLLFGQTFVTFLKFLLEAISPFCESTDTPLLDFWWHPAWVSKPGWIPWLCASSPEFNEFLSFTFGVTPADLLTTSMAAEPFYWSTYLHVCTRIGGSRAQLLVSGTVVQKSYRATEHLYILLLHFRPKKPEMEFFLSSKNNKNNQELGPKLDIWSWSERCNLRLRKWYCLNMSLIRRDVLFVLLDEIVALEPNLIKSLFTRELVSTLARMLGNERTAVGYG